MHSVIEDDVYTAPHAAVTFISKTLSYINQFSGNNSSCNRFVDLH